MTAEITIIEPNRPALAKQPDYQGMIDVLLGGMSINSRRQYQHTYDDWRGWCEQMGIHPDELGAPNVRRYLQHKPLSRATRQARLTHLRRLVQSLYSADTGNIQLETYYAQLKLLRLSVDDTPGAELPTKGKKRKGKRLDAQHIHDLIGSYPEILNGKPYLKGLRNRALLAVLFYAGLRRFEAAKLKWEDIDFEQEHIQVVGGKGRQRDEIQYVPFLGSIFRHLKVWRDALTAAGGAGRVYVFPRFRRGDFLGADKPMTADGLYGQFHNDFMPHDARRTLISDLLDSGTYIGDVRVIARHASESTTLRYAKAHDTKVIKSRAKLGY